MSTLGVLRSYLGEIELIILFVLNIGEQSFMQYKQNILAFYATGRYECDYDFHANLLQLIRELNMYEWEGKLEGQTQLVRKIKELTLLNSKHSDEDYEDDQLISQTYKIKSLISNINTNDIRLIIKECEELGWEPYAVKVRRAISGKPEYEKILERIQSTVHSEQFRIDCMLFTALFEQVNGQAVNQFIEVYSVVVELYLRYLTACRREVETVSESSKISNICALPRTIKFITSIYHILRTCLRFCEIIKVLAGKNNLSLKFTVIKKEIEKLIKCHPQWRINDQKDDVFAVLPEFKQCLKGRSQFDRSRICRWCFKVMRKEVAEHSFCREIIEKRTAIAKEQ